MRERKVLLCMVLAAVMLVSAATAGLASPQWAGPKQYRERVMIQVQARLFEDEDDAPWAIGYMMKSLVKGFMKGYPDGRFMPNASISQTEAIVAVLRFAEIEEENVPDDFDQWPPGIQAVRWAKAALYTAYLKGLIELDDFEVNKAASRSWVCSLLPMALGEEEPDDETLEGYYNELEFLDKASIPSDHVWGVYWAWTEGIVDGYPNGMFLPNKPVTRAEVAKILDLSDVTVTRVRMVRGTFVELGEDDEGDTIAITPKKGGEQTFLLDPDVRVFVSGQTVELDFLLEGDPVLLEVRDSTVLRIFVLLNPDVDLGDEEDDEKDEDDESEHEEDDEEDDE